MLDKIKELQKEGKSIREISESLNISSSKCFRILHETDSETLTVSPVSDANVTASETVTETARNCPMSWKGPKEECPYFNEVNQIGVKKLRACEYTKEGYKRFESSPPWFKCVKPTPI